VQLSIYALLASREDDEIEEVTVQILSPHFDFEPFTYTRAELDRLYHSVQIVINSVSDPGDPTPGPLCQFCPARLICPAARTEAEQKDEAPTEFDELARALHQHAKALAELQKALQKVRRTLFGEPDA
jgi:hypothetical protein